MASLPFFVELFEEVLGFQYRDGPRERAMGSETPSGKSAGIRINSFGRAVLASLL